MSSPIRVSAAREDAHIAISVADKGPGVAPERLAQLFNKHAGIGDGERAKAGHGLGLAICKGLVEAHGGRIRAESAGVGHGATVTFTLPIAGEPEAEVATGMPTAAGEKGEPARILVVDDDPRTLRFTRDALTKAGYDPLVTGEPQDLAHIVRTEKPRLVLLDVVLPGEDGITLMEGIPELSNLPVIFISGYGRDETVARALESGAADYIVKPFSPTELVARVRAALRRHEEPEPFVLGELAIDYDRHRVTICGDPVVLTATEFELLRALSLNAGRVVAYDTLLARVWSGRGKADANLVRNLRQEPPPKARRRRGKSHLDLQRARRRIPQCPNRERSERLASGMELHCFLHATHFGRRCSGKMAVIPPPSGGFRATGCCPASARCHIAAHPGPGRLQLRSGAAGRRCPPSFQSASAVCGTRA